MNRNEEVNVKDSLIENITHSSNEDSLFFGLETPYPNKNLTEFIEELNSNYSKLKLSFINLKNKIVNVVKSKDIDNLRLILSQIKTQYPAINISDFTIEGLSLLHYAAFHNQIEMIDMLIDLGIFVDFKNNDYIDEENIITQAATPLIFAIKGGGEDAVKLLLSKGADINARYNSLSKTSRTLSLTPLHTAAYKGNLNIVKTLIDEGIEINSLTKEGFTPLHAAAWSGNKNIVKFLLSKGAIIFIKNNAGFTASEIALSKGNTEIVKVFDNCHRMQAFKYLSPICICVLAVVLFL
jgi:ankyrin repeat protein